MINIPLPQIKERISQKTGLSEDEVNQKIKAKLKQLPGLISEEGAAHIVANELGVKLFDIGEKLQIKNIFAGMRNVDVIGKVLQKYEVREFSKGETSGKVANLLIGDETGVVRVVLWQKQADLMSQLKEGDVVKIRGGYVRENNGRKEVHLSEISKLIINPPGVEVSVQPYNKPESVRKQIAEIKEDDADVEILATIVQVFDLNFFEVCPQCNKRIRLKDEGFMCPTHGKVVPDYNYVLNMYLDDGSDNIRVVFWRNQVEELLDRDKAHMMSFKEDPSKFEPIKTELLGNIIKVHGRANKNQNFDRVELIANRVYKNPDPDEEIKKLKEEAERAVEASKQKLADPEIQKSWISESKTESFGKPGFSEAKEEPKQAPSKVSAAPKPDFKLDVSSEEGTVEDFNIDEKLVDPDSPIG
jgi:replication factor A1